MTNRTPTGILEEDIHSGEGVKLDKGKTQWELMPLQQVNEVLQMIPFKPKDGSRTNLEQEVFTHLSYYSSGIKFCFTSHILAYCIRDLLAIMKMDAEKVCDSSLIIIPYRQLETVAEIMTFGAEKYAPNNWQKVRPINRYIGAAYRHLVAYCKGIDKDEESGKSPLAHAICCMLYLMWFDDEGIEE